MGDQAPHAPRPARAKHTDAVHRPHPGVPPRAQPAAARTHQLTRAQPPIDLNRVGTYHHHWVHLHAPSTALPSGQGTGRAVALLGHGQPAVAHDEGATPTAAPHNRHRAERRYPTAPSSTSSSFNNVTDVRGDPGGEDLPITGGRVIGERDRGQLDRAELPLAD